MVSPKSNRNLTYNNAIRLKVKRALRNNHTHVKPRLTKEHIRKHTRRLTNIGKRNVNHSALNAEMRKSLHDLPRSLHNNYRKRYIHADNNEFSVENFMREFEKAGFKERQYNWE